MVMVGVGTCANSGDEGGGGGAIAAVCGSKQ